MQTKLLIANGVLVAALIWDVKVHRRTKSKYQRIAEMNHDLRDQVDRHLAQMAYLCQMLDRHEIPVDEFDLIALNNPMQ